MCLARKLWVGAEGPLLDCGRNTSNPDAAICRPCITPGQLSDVRLAKPGSSSRCARAQIFSKSVTAAAVAVTGDPDEFEKIALKVCCLLRCNGRF